MRSKLAIGLLVALSIVLVACGPQAAPSPQVVKETVEVEKEVVVKETVEVEKEVVVTATPEARPVAEKYSLFYNTLFHGGDAQAMERIVKKYNEAHGNTQLTLAQGQWSQYYAQLTNAVIAGNAPQIGIVHTNMLPEMYPALMPLEETPAGNLLEAGGIEPGNYIESLWKAGEKDGRRYLIPLDTHMFGMWYNRDIFEEAGLDPDSPPQTMEEFIAAADAIRDAGYAAFHPAEDALPRKLRRAWMVFFWQQGGELFDEGYTQATFNNEQGLKALEFLVSMVQERSWNEPGTDGFKQFTAGELGMFVAGNWMYWTASESDVNWDFAPMPVFFDQPATWGNSHNLVIPKQPGGVSNEVLVKAAEAIKWINENSDTWGIYGGHIPAYKPTLESEELQESDTWQGALAQFADMASKGWVHYPITHPKASQLNNAIQVYVQEAYNGTISPQEALDKAEAECNQILQSD
ncbi:MAG: sn-glycerol-3-phosphate-binding periplasmic protein UgpB [Anaerolineales bacterium]|nr:sn-glycerol-3-phosphate-binding periplasmic protein UgpB [Anaerolineales bacterium]